MRVVAVMLLLSAGIATEAMSYSFVSKASGRLGRPIRFEFYRDSTTRPRTDIESFTVSMRTADDRWKAMWSILSRPWSDTADRVRWKIENGIRYMRKTSNHMPQATPLASRG